MVFEALANATRRTHSGRQCRRRHWRNLPRIQRRHGKRVEGRQRGRSQLDRWRPRSGKLWDFARIITVAGIPVGREIGTDEIASAYGGTAGYGLHRGAYCDRRPADSEAVRTDGAPRWSWARPRRRKRGEWKRRHFPVLLLAQPPAAWAHDSSHRDARSGVDEPAISAAAVEATEEAIVNALTMAENHGRARGPCRRTPCRSIGSPTSLRGIGG